MPSMRFMMTALKLDLTVVAQFLINSEPHSRTTGL
jgi:hypothetical protein